jgi:hypothetical protein
VFSLLDEYDFRKLSLSYSIHIWTLGPSINEYEGFNESSRTHHGSD